MPRGKRKPQGRWSHKCTRHGDRHVMYQGVKVPIHCAKSCDVCGDLFVVIQGGICCPDDKAWHIASVCCLECSHVKQAEDLDRRQDARDLANADLHAARKRQIQEQKMLDRINSGYAMQTSKSTARILQRVAKARLGKQN